MSVQLATAAPSQAPSLRERIAEYKDPIIKVALAALFFGGIAMMICGGIHHNPWLAFGGALPAASGISLSMDYSCYKWNLSEENKSIIKIYQQAFSREQKLLLPKIPLPTAEEEAQNPKTLSERAEQALKELQRNQTLITELCLYNVSRLPPELYLPSLKSLDISLSPNIQWDHRYNFRSHFPALTHLKYSPHKSPPRIHGHITLEGVV